MVRPEKARCGTLVRRIRIAGEQMTTHVIDDGWRVIVAGPDDTPIAPRGTYLLVEATPG
jgi:hypothetical protein